MEEKVYKGIYVLFNDSAKEYLYITTDNRVSVGDFVYIKGNEKQALVTRVISFTKETSPYPFEKIKSIDDKSVEAIEVITKPEETVSTPVVEKQEDDILSSSVIKDITLNLELLEEFSYADYHTDSILKLEEGADSTEFSLIKKITINNKSNDEYNDLILRFIFSSDIFSMTNINISSLKEQEEISLKIPFLKVNREKIEVLNSKDIVSLRIELLDSNDKLVTYKEQLFNVLPFSQPSKLMLQEPRLYAKYITPLVAEVKQITLNAIKHNKGKPIIAYQNIDKNAMLQELQAIYLALFDAKIAYQNPPVGGYYTQRIRMPKEVLTDKKGTCLDLSLLMCACLEEVGYKSLLIIIDGHAFAGAILDHDLSLPHAIETKVASIYNKSTAGNRSIALIECTQYTITQPQSFQDSMNCAISNIKMYNGQIFFAIDIKLAQSKVFSPVTMDEQISELEQIYNGNQRLNKKIDYIKERKYINVLRENEKDRFTFWERKLLDLTESNPLVNFKLKPSNCIKVTSDSYIYDLIAKQDKVQMFSIESNGKVSAEYVEYEFEKGLTKPSDIYGSSVDKDKLLGIGFEKTLKNLIKKSNSSMEETGAPTLYLCMGMLTYDRKKGEKGHSPFMVLPIKITKDRMGIYYSISYDYDDVMINQTFFEYYSQEHQNVDFSQLYRVGANDNYLDIVHAFKENNTEDIQLDENSFFIANLTFSHYIMWLDVRKRKEELKKNKVIESILNNRNLIGDDLNIETNKIDELEQYQDFAAPLYYDSTQLKAILQCGNGKSFILDGPPGTGKSQTIVNMIVNAFYHGKTVLFIAEKKAALDVVADRLRKLGDPNSENNLGRFCLELHSNKANKADFFQKLNKSMELGVIKDPLIFDEKCRDLDNKRDELVKVINKMHTNKYFFSLYESINKYFDLKYLNNHIEFNESYLLSLNDKKYKETNSYIEEFIASSNNINDYNNNPLKIIKASNLNFSDKNNIINGFSVLRTMLSDVIKEYKELVKKFNLPLDSEYNTINLLFTLLDICFNKKMYSNKITDYFNFTYIELIEEVFKRTRNLLNYRNELLKFIDINRINTIDFNNLYNGFTRSSLGFFAKFFGKMKAKKALKSILLPQVKINGKMLVDIYELMINYNDCYEFIKSKNNILTTVFDFNYLSNVDNIDEIIECYNNTYNFSLNVKKLYNNENFISICSILINLYNMNDSLLKMQFNFIKSKYDQYKKLEQELFTKFKIDYNYFTDGKLNIIKLQEFLNYSSCEDNFNEIINISQINNIAIKLSELGLNELIDLLTFGKCDYTLFKEMYEYSLAKCYINLYFKDEDINYFNPSTFNSKVKQYKDLISDYNNLIIAKVSAKLTKELNHNNMDYASSSPIGRLKKTILNNGRGVTIRETLLNYDSLIRKYFPCFLMSPLSAAQYLAVDQEGKRSVSKFDLVIFDEASQIPTHEAVGPIARGTSLIVAGDPEQMPPTQFFNSDIELSCDELEFEDAQSLLDECLSIELPRIRLEYHYRSKHESLINFSNHNFYNDKLHTFPSPSTSKSFISFKHVNIGSQKQNSDISKEELNTIVNTIKEIYSDDNTKKKSLGIIVFNMKQQEKLSDYLADVRANDKALDETISKAEELTNEPLFVKSLENVQGDERDIIIISIGYRINMIGKAIVNGPLIRTNGERRLNVAVSRSKEQMIVVSTIRYTDFDDDAFITNKGKLLLKQFLYFAENKSFNRSIKNLTTNSAVIEQIRNDLMSEGYEVDLNVGNSEFKVDLAIKNKNGDRYSLGVLVDSKEIGTYYSCRDKMYVQDSVLNALKWKLINVYSLEYFKDKKTTIAKIINAISEPYVKQEANFNPIIEQEAVKKFEYNSTNYKKVRTITYVKYSNETGYSSDIERLIKEIVECESPVSFEVIKNRVREHSNIQNMSTKAKSRLLYIVNKLIVNKTSDQEQLVFWNTNPVAIVNQFRTSDRDIYDIPKEEIVGAMKQILNVQVELSKEDLFRCTLDAFSYGQSTLNKKNIARLEYVYNWAKNNNLI